MIGGLWFNAAIKATDASSILTAWICRSLKIHNSQEACKWKGSHRVKWSPVTPATNPSTSWLAMHCMWNIDSAPTSQQKTNSNATLIPQIWLTRHLQLFLSESGRGTWAHSNSAGVMHHINREQQHEKGRHQIHVDFNVRTDQRECVWECVVVHLCMWLSMWLVFVSTLCVCVCARVHDIISLIAIPTPRSQPWTKTGGKWEIVTVCRRKVRERLPALWFFLARPQPLYLWHEPAPCLYHCDAVDVEENNGNTVGCEDLLDH